jgi:hypothetical protein
VQRVAVKDRHIVLEHVDIVGIHAIAVFGIVFADLLANILDPPVLAVDK